MRRTQSDRRWAALAAGVLLLSLLTSPQGVCAQEEGATPEGFEGRWETTYGRLTLAQSGEEVTGTYGTSGLSGRIEGRVEGDTLVFRYTESSGVEGEGRFQLSEDGEAFEGTWRVKGASAWQPWGGARVKAPAVEPGVPFDGLYDTTYGRMRLSRSGERVSGSYLGSTRGTLEGRVEEGRFTFTYDEGAVSGEGWFEASGDTLSGSWRPSGAAPWKTWTGTRVRPDPRVRWLVVLETHWERSLLENEYSFGEMLRSYFERLPNVRVRQRRISDREDFLRAGAELTYIAEPVVVLISGHGSPEGLTLSGEVLGEDALTAVLAPADNVLLVHFSSCDILAGDIPGRVLKKLPEGAVISGYAEPVDWAASAVFEMLYLDLVLGRHMSPREAADVGLSEMNFADDDATPGSPLGAMRFRLLER